jgi:predicted NACHT family NTPase
VPYESIERFPCLGLLGEPGIGKTHTMQAQRSGINQKAAEEGGRTLWLDLGSYLSEDRLIRDLFAGEAFIAWTQGGYRLHIFLDSLDECLLRIDTVAALLGSEFEKYSDAVQCLSLRIACRTAPWPTTLEETLRSLWGKDFVEVYELAPLRRRDVVEAAQAKGVDADAFLREVDHKAVAPLAMKPVTLGFLLNIYQKNGGFPSTQTELYRQGCRVLCEETNASRRDARLTGTLTAEQRMAVAARVAAVTVFANRYAVWTSPDVGDVPEEDVSIGQLSGGKEAASGNDFEVGEAAVREALVQFQ